MTQEEVYVGTLMAAVESGDLHGALDVLQEYSAYMGEYRKVTLYKDSEGDICIATESGVELIVMQDGSLDVAGG